MLLITPDHAAEADGVIVHFSVSDKPVLIEVPEASDFISHLAEIAALAKKGEALPV